MKVKYWLIVLLALILPLKGVMAAAGMRCHQPGSVSTQVEHAPSVHGPSSHDAHHAHASGDGHGAAHAGQDGAHGRASDDGQASDPSCLACAAICGASPLPPAIADRVPAVESARDWYAPAVPKPPRPTLGTLERPPRTL